MIYIVTGDGPRCGSVMMMTALKQGGLRLSYDPREDNAAHKRATGDYHPSPEGLLEIGLDIQQSVGFPQPAFNGTAIKLFGNPWGCLNDIVPGEYRIVWLHRPSQARWASFHRFHEQSPLIWCDGDPEHSRAAERYRDEKGAETLAILHLRPDVQVTELDYDHVVDNPLEAFQALANAGWPIDIEAAAGVPDPSRRRFSTP